MDQRIPVAVYGATGLVGQRLVQMLDAHPWFRAAILASSDGAVGKPYASVPWQLPGAMPANARELIVQPTVPHEETRLVLSALPSDVAGEVETALRAAGHIISSAAACHRFDADVPLVVSEVNPDHLELVLLQQARHGGAIVCNGNASAIHLALALKPLEKAFGLRRVVVTTLQAVGAGDPVVTALDMVDNVIPYIDREEGRLESEPLKILGKLQDDNIQGATFKISATCNRVGTTEGDLEIVSVELDRAAALDDVRRALVEFTGEPQELELPSAPRHPIVVCEEDDRPQPRRDRDVERGMATVVGRLRACNVLDYRITLLGHNTIRGAAGSTLLNAEHLLAKGLIGAQ
jgi:aspartate-semialdehyde dehydrogenase